MIGSILFIIALLLYGALLAGIDAAEEAARHLSIPVDAERVMPSESASGCYYVSAVGSLADVRRIP